MDRRVKERLVGASILVALIVLIVPELLSGPPLPRQPAPAPQPVRTVTVDLTTNKAPAAEPAADPAVAPNTSAGGNEIPPAPSQAAPAPSQAAPAPSRTPPASSRTSSAAGRIPPAAARVPPTAVETAPPAPRSAVTAGRPAMAGAWAVQLGSFAARGNAEKLARQLRAQGFSVYVVSSGSGASLRYRVRIGPMADRSAAAAAVAKLKSLGHNASFVPPAR